MEDKLRFLWEHRFTGWALGMAGFAVALGFIWHSPSPGVSVTVLGGVAAIMSIRQLSSWEKFFWTSMIFALLYAELHAIKVDRREQDRHQLADRAAQDLAFKDVRDAQNRDFSATVSGLKTAITGIESTLKAADTTLVQTRPRADVRFESFAFAGTAPSVIKPNTPYKFNFVYTNSGAESTRRLRVAGKVYVSMADSEEAQRQLASEFESEWSKGKSRLVVPTQMGPGDSSFGTIPRSFSEEEIKDLSLAGTVYFLVRFEYEDDLGKWWTDSCVSFQRQTSAINSNILHSCLVFTRPRYPAKRLRDS